MRSLKVLMVGSVMLACQPAEDAPRVNRRPLEPRVPVANYSWTEVPAQTLKCEITGHSNSGGEFALRRPEETSGEILARVSDIVTDSTEVFVVDGGDGQIHVYDEHRRLSRVIGKRGDGPGELAGPTSVAVSGDTVFVLDGAAERIHVFSRAGRFVRRWSLPTGIPAGTEAVSIAVSEEHVFLGLFVNLNPEAKPRPALPGYGVLRTSRTGEAPLLLDQLTEEDLRSGAVRGAKGAFRFVAISGGRLLVGDDWNTEVRALDMDGRPLWRHAGCLSYPSGEDDPGRPPGAAGGLKVGARLHPVGTSLVARLLPAPKEGVQHLELIAVGGGRAWTMPIQRSESRERFTHAGIGPRSLVVGDASSATVAWAPMSIPLGIVP